MPFNHQITTVYKTSAGTVMNETENVSGTNQGVDIDTTIQAGMTQKFDVKICPETVQSMMICSDQPTTVTTESLDTPKDTIILKAHVGLVWTLNSWWPVPLAPGDVNYLYVHNDGAAAAHFQMRVLSIGEQLA